MTKDEAGRISDARSSVKAASNLLKQAMRSTQKTTGHDGADMTLEGVAEWLTFVRKNLDEAREILDNLAGLRS